MQTGSRTTFRGQIFAKDVNVGEEGVLSRELVFEKESDPEKIIEEQGVRLFANEMVIILDESATFNDVQDLIGLVNGETTGFVPNPQTYKILVESSTFIELSDLIFILNNSNNPLLFEAIPNIIIE